MKTNQEGMRRQKNAISEKSAEAISKLLTELIAQCEGKGWQKPWLSCSGLPAMNIKQGAPYQGINALLLNGAVAVRGYKTPFFLTLKQMTAMGLRLRQKPDGEREHAYPVIKWIVQLRDQDGNKLTGEDYDCLPLEEKERCRKYFTLREYLEYNLDQTDIEEVQPELYQKYLNIYENSKGLPSQAADAADPTLDFMLQNRSGWRCPITHDGGDRAYYRPATDSIHLPLREQFRTVSGYYTTALHEMVHSTMAEPTMHRDYGAQGFGSEGYATEELVAELSAAIIAFDLGLEKTVDEQHLVYVKNWMRAVKDKDVIARIVPDIMRCTRYLLAQYDRIEAYTQKLLAA